MSRSNMLINIYKINKCVSYNMLDYKDQIQKHKQTIQKNEENKNNKVKKEKPKEKINKFNNERLFSKCEIAFEIVINEKFIWSERVVDIKIKGKQKNKKLKISQPSTLEIEKTYGILKPIKIKSLISINDLKQEYNQINFTIENCISFTLTSTALPSSKNQLSTFTPNSTNKLFYYLPSLTDNQLVLQNQSEISNSYLPLNKEIVLLDEQYEKIKLDLIEINPLLQSSAAIREQFFINASEGKTEKYHFIKNLYDIINNNKPKRRSWSSSKQKTTINAITLHSENKRKHMVPLNNKHHNFKTQSKTVMNRNNGREGVIVKGFQGLRLLSKSASGNSLYPRNTIIN